MSTSKFLNLACQKEPATSPKKKNNVMTNLEQWHAPLLLKFKF
jgi:hypothetical protein